MKLLKRCYLILSIVCICSVISDLNLHFFWEGILWGAVPLSIILFYFIELILKEIMSMIIEPFLDICSNRLPNDDAQALIKYLVKEPDSLQSIDKFFDRTYSFIEKNFTAEQLKLINEDFISGLDSSNADMFKTSNSSIVLRVGQALRLDYGSIIKRFVRAVPSIEDSNKTRWIPLFDVLLFFPPFLLLCAMVLFPSIMDYKTLSISITYVCAVDFIQTRKGRTGIFKMLLYWVSHFCCTIALPALVTSYNLLSAENFVFFHLNFIILIVVGIQLINRLWTQTSIEKNKGAFVADRKLVDIINTKWLMMLRTPSLWCLFFLSVFGTIMMYTFIFENHLNCGNTLYCLLFSISTYFGGGQEIVESIEGLYIASETIFSFLLNTLYLANIVRLILEPKLSKE